MCDKAMDNQINKQSGKELLNKAFKQWKRDGLLESNNEGKSLSKKRLNRDEEVVNHNLETDPVINLFMSAMAYQTNLLREQIAGLQTDLLNEYIRKTLPFPLHALCLL